MKTDILLKKGNTLKFVLDDSNVAFANALRRTMITEVPVLAIEDVTFFENSSAIFDEILAHKLGLIPIKTDKTFNSREDCSCKGKGCSKCQIEFTLVKKGPCTVYSGDLKSSDSKITVANEEIPIVKLLENQKIKLEAVAVASIGKKHAKFQPGVISYKYYPKIKLKGAGKEVVDICPRGVFELKGNKVEVKDEQNCSLCMACAEETDGKVEVKGLDTKFIFTVESHGNMKPEEIVLEAADVLERKAKELQKELK